LSFIRADEIDYGRARNAGLGEKAKQAAKVLDLLENRNLVIFTGCLVLFQLADASMLPLLAENLAVEASSPTLRMSGLINIPQIIVAILAPWVGYHSEARGRRSLLLLGFGLEPVRATLLAFTASYPFAIVAQVLDGISAAIITVLTVLVVTDLTTGTGRFNLARGTAGAMSSIAASVSTIATGSSLSILVTSPASCLSPQCNCRDGTVLGVPCRNQAKGLPGLGGPITALGGFVGGSGRQAGSSIRFGSGPVRQTLMHRRRPETIRGGPGRM